VRRLTPLLVASALCALAAPGGATAQLVTQDSAIGSGTAGEEWSFDFHATSGPSGENPSGEVRFVFQGTIQVEGTVSCLGVTGNQAVIGVDVTFSSAGPFPGAFVNVTDGGGPAGEDTFDARPEWGGVPSDCSVPPPFLAERTVDSGDIIVHDAPPFSTSKEQCRNGGWRTFGVFKNQGDCISFALTGGKNPPAPPAEPPA
jgi:hypothetical protein